MVGPIEICTKNVNEILGILEKLLSAIGGINMARPDRENVKNIEINRNNFDARSRSGEIDGAVSSAKMLAVHAQGLGMGISTRAKHYGVEASNFADLLADAAGGLIRRIDNDEEFSLPHGFKIEPLESFGGVSERSISLLRQEIMEMQAKLKADVESFERMIAKGVWDIDEFKKASASRLSGEISSVSGDLDKVRIELESIKAVLEDKVSEAESISEEAVKRSREVNSQIDDLLGQNASKVLLIDYANTAEKEGESADKMRAWSLGCMAVSGLVVFAALYQTLSVDFDWHQVMVKAFAAIALSIPAAYLARESSKHRAQEHLNRRISLDLKAMAPYIASLPSDEQNKIKSDVASKIFGVQGAGASDSADDYPMNVQEILKLLIDKIPSK